MVTLPAAPSRDTRDQRGERPLLRGWIHVGAAVASVPTGIVLVACAPSARSAAGCAVYALSVTLLFAVSALYHRHTWSDLGRAIVARVDHAMIFVTIAATYTPLALTVMRSRAAEVVLAVVWSGGIIGATLRGFAHRTPRWAFVPLYIALGWAAIPVIPDLLHHGGVAPLVLLIVGGGLYSLGAIVYALGWPDPWPATFGYHEVFHVLTVVAFICHYIAVFLAVWAPGAL